MNLLKKLLPDAVAVLLFALISFAYFFPADTEGRILYRHDSSAGRGAGEELTEYYQRTGECGGTAERVTIGVAVAEKKNIICIFKNICGFVQVNSHA